MLKWREHRLLTRQLCQVSPLISLFSNLSCLFLQKTSLARIVNLRSRRKLVKIIWTPDILYEILLWTTASTDLWTLASNSSRAGYQDMALLECFYVKFSEPIISGPKINRTTNSFQIMLHATYYMLQATSCMIHATCWMNYVTCFNLQSTC